MPRYVVQRTFPEGLQIPGNGHGAELCRGVTEHNAQQGVTWITSFVSKDREPAPSASTTHPLLRPFAGQPSAASYRSTRSLRSACLIRISADRPRSVRTESEKPLDARSDSDE
jgi:hypothetical protein